MTLRMRKALKWLIWTLFLFVLSALSSAPIFPSLFGVRPQLVLAAGISAAVIESNAVFACGYCILSGLILDVLQGQLFGFYGLLMLIAGAVVSRLMKSILRVNIWNAGWLSALISLLHGIVCAELTLFIWGYAEGKVWEVFLRLLIRAVYTGAAAPGICLVMRVFGDRIIGTVKKEYHFSGNREKG